MFPKRVLCTGSLLPSLCADISKYIQCIAMKNQALEMWKIMLCRELECVPCLVRSATSAINSSPWRNPLLLVSSGKAFVRTADWGEKASSRRAMF